MSVKQPDRTDETRLQRSTEMYFGCFYIQTATSCVSLAFATKPVQHNGSSCSSVSVETSKQNGRSGIKPTSKPSRLPGRVKPSRMKVICKVSKNQHNFILFLNPNGWLCFYFDSWSHGRRGINPLTSLCLGYICCFFMLSYTSQVFISIWAELYSSGTVAATWLTRLNHSNQVQPPDWTTSAFYLLTSISNLGFDCTSPCQQIYFYEFHEEQEVGDVFTKFSQKTRANKCVILLYITVRVWSGEVTNTALWCLAAYDSMGHKSEFVTSSCLYLYRCLR